MYLLCRSRQLVTWREASTGEASLSSGWSVHSFPRMLFVAYERAPGLGPMGLGLRQFAGYEPIVGTAACLGQRTGRRRGRRRRRRRRWWWWRWWSSLVKIDGDPLSTQQEARPVGKSWKRAHDIRPMAALDPSSLQHVHITQLRLDHRPQHWCVGAMRLQLTVNNGLN